MSSWLQLRTIIGPCDILLDWCDRFMVYLGRLSVSILIGGVFFKSFLLEADIAFWVGFILRGLSSLGLE